MAGIEDGDYKDEKIGCKCCSSSHDLRTNLLKSGIMCMVSTIPHSSPALSPNL